MNKFFSLFFLWKVCASQTQDLDQPTSILRAELGDNVTVECSMTNENINYMGWYKLTPGMVLQHVVTKARYIQDVTFYDEFDDGRFNIFSDEETFHLNIPSIKQADIGTYYCGKIFLNQMQFAGGTLLILTGITSRIKYIVQQPVSESVQPGASVTLSCTIHTEACAGGHRVYWFRHGPGESRPGIIYTHGDRRRDPCERSPEAGSPTQSCVYHLPKRNLSLSDAGTYYCAVASCGETLFGNGTKLDIQEQDFPLSPAALALVASNVLCVIAIVVLTCGICKRRDTGPRGENESPTSTTNQNQDSDVLNYAAVSFAPRSSSSSTRPRVNASTDAAVYSEVSYLQQE